MNEEYRVITIEDSQAASKEDVLQKLASELQFPEYFGGNLDAFADCLAEVSSPVVLQFLCKGHEPEVSWVHTIYKIACDVAEWNEKVRVECVEEEGDGVDAATGCLSVEGASEADAVTGCLSVDGAGEAGAAENRFEPGDIVQHFKRETLDDELKEQNYYLYRIVGKATHSETREQMMVYQALYGDQELYVRPLDMFLSEVDHEKYPDIQQKNRFELVEDTVFEVYSF